MPRKLIALVVVLVSAVAGGLALAGCGDSSDGEARAQPTAAPDRAATPAASRCLASVRSTPGRVTSAAGLRAISPSRTAPSSPARSTV